MDSIDKLNKSFNENFKNNKQSIEYFKPLFTKMADELKQLNVVDVFVDVSFKKNIIDFNLCLEEGLFLSVASSVDNTTDEVMFYISRNHKTLVIDIMPLKELVHKTIDILCQLKNINANTK